MAEIADAQCVIRGQRDALSLRSGMLDTLLDATSRSIEHVYNCRSQRTGVITVIPEIALIGSESSVGSFGMQISL